MNKEFLLSTILTLSTLAFCGEKEGNLDRIQDPGMYLNSQDVSIFYQGNPLHGLNAFAVIPPASIQNKSVYKKIGNLIEKELGKIGKVTKAKNNNMGGFASGNLLNIQIGQISKWEGTKLPITRITLNVETPATVIKTGTKSLLRVWSINDFIDCPLNIQSEEMMVGAVGKLVAEFVKNYKFANGSPLEKPTFFVYY